MQKHFTSILFFCLAILICSCSVGKKGISSKQFRTLIDESTAFNQHNTGFALYDPEKDRMLHGFNSHQYYVPASNTKLFTFYAGLHLLGDSVPGLRYMEQGDSLVFWGTGDPSFLYPDSDNGRVYNFLKEQKKTLYFSDDNDMSVRKGPGWSWDWYGLAFAPEVTPFPINSNVIKFSLSGKGEKPAASPLFFNRYIDEQPSRDYQSTLARALDDNAYYYRRDEDVRAATRYIPFKYSPQMVTGFLEDTLLKPVNYARVPLTGSAKTLMSVPSDSLYKRMLQKSDNMIAEQLLLMYSGIISDTLNSRMAIRYFQDSLLLDFPDEPQWSDGSGLSKYNLFTPRTMIHLLKAIQQMVPEERLFAMLPAGGESGTIKNLYKAEQPYVFAKTGTLSNTTALSGYIKTSTGKTLLFCFFHNNFVGDSASLKRSMEEVLREVRDRY